MSFVPYHQPCPDRPGQSLTEVEKRRGYEYLGRIRHELCQRQLAPLRRERQELVCRIRVSVHVLARLRLQIRLYRLDREMFAIRQRWLKPELGYGKFEMERA